MKLRNNKKSLLCSILAILFSYCMLHPMDHNHQGHQPMLSEHGNHEEHTTHGMFGNYPMGQDSSGTSWIPASTQLPGIHLQHKDWTFMIHGFGTAIYDHQGGCRGAKKFFSENALMFTAQKNINRSIFALRGMFSLEPGTIGKCGYPLLLQTGETANGRTPLIDRQHPHDFFMELAAVYTCLLSDSDSIFAYFGMPGEPALGPTNFMHRFSALYNPEAPITHHWLDSTHISFGVATLGWVHRIFKLDGSIFTGREPDQHRWNFDKPRFDSYSIRASLNPTENIALQMSYGFLKSPEQLEPCIDIHRTTASVSYNKAWDTINWQITGAWGVNKNSPGRWLNGGLLESAISVHKKHIFFARVECVRKEELFIEPDPRASRAFTVGKLDAGYLYEYPLIPATRWGLGFVTSASFVPSSLKNVYGNTPFSYMVFLRVDLDR